MIDVVLHHDVVTGVELIAVDTTVSVNPAGDVSANECHGSGVMLPWMNMGTQISQGAIKPDDTIVNGMVGIDR